MPSRARSTPPSLSMSGDGPSIGGLAAAGNHAAEAAAGSAASASRAIRTGRTRRRGMSRRTPRTGTGAGRCNRREARKLRRGPDGSSGPDHQSLRDGLGAEALGLARAARRRPSPARPRAPRATRSGACSPGASSVARRGQPEPGAAQQHVADAARLLAARRRTSPRPAGRACRGGSAGRARRARAAIASTSCAA